MKKKLTKNIANTLTWNNGYFHGLKKILNEYEISDKTATAVKAELFRHILTKITEGKKEIIHLQQAVARLESACRAGTVPNPQTAREAFNDNNVRALQLALIAFDGWVISLLETDISLLWAVHNPESAGIRINGLKDSFVKLYALRAPGIKPFENFPEVFDLGLFWE